MSEKIYCGNAKIVSTIYGELTKVSFSKDDINKMITYMKGNNLDWINLVVKEKKNKVEGKPTHYLEVDEWKPEKQPSNDSNTVSSVLDQPEDGQLPF